MGSVAGEVSTISLEKIIFPKEGRPRVYKPYAVGFHRGILVVDWLPGPWCNFPSNGICEGPDQPPQGG